MVILVLNDTGGHALGFAFDAGTGLVQAGEPDAARPRHRAAQARDGQAPLPSGVGT
jgi:hypothetical protein